MIVLLKNEYDQWISMLEKKAKWVWNDFNNSVKTVIFQFLYLSIRFQSRFFYISVCARILHIKITENETRKICYLCFIMSHSLLWRPIVLLTVGVYSSNHRVLYIIGISMTRRFQKSVSPSHCLFVCNANKKSLLLHYWQ